MLRALSIYPDDYSTIERTRNALWPLDSTKSRCYTAPPGSRVPMFNVRPSGVLHAGVATTPKLEWLGRNIGDAIFVSGYMVLVARSDSGHMTSHLVGFLTVRLDRQTAFGFGRLAAGSSTPRGALQGDVCTSWPTSAAVEPMTVVAAQRDRTQSQTKIDGTLVNDRQYSPSLQSQSRIGAGTEGGGRSTS